MQQARFWVGFEFSHRLEFLRMGSVTDVTQQDRPVLSPAREMDLYARYLTGRPADVTSRDLFLRAGELGLLKLEPGEETLRQFILRNPWGLGPVDAAMALFQPKNGLRRRMILAFAILEANPHYFETFRPRSFYHTHLLTLVCRGAAELFKALIGRILLWLV